MRRRARDRESAVDGGCGDGHKAAAVRESAAGGGAAAATGRGAATDARGSTGVHPTLLALRSFCGPALSSYIQLISGPRSMDIRHPLPDLSMDVYEW
jgi:hypothetical protein